MLAFRLDKGEAEEIQETCAKTGGEGHLPTPAATAEGVSSDSRFIAIRPDLTRSITP